MRAERMRERSATLRPRLVSARRAAFSADLVFATKTPKSGSFEGRVVCSATPTLSTLFTDSGAQSGMIRASSGFFLIFRVFAG